MRLTNGFGTVKVVMLKGETGEQGPQGIQGIQGIQGEPFEFEDFTEEQLAELRADVASVYYRKLEATYHTVGENTTTIEIPFNSYLAGDMLFIDVEGLALTEGTDYTIDGTSIVLVEPITHHWTAVNFRLMRAIAIAAEDYDALKGDDGEVQFAYLKPSYVRGFETVADMQAADDLIEGMICHANGFHTSGDGGAAYYTIGASGTADNCTVIACGNLFASRVFVGDSATLESLNYQNVEFSVISASIIAAGIKTLTAKSVTMSESVTVDGFDFEFDELTYTGADYAIIIDGVRRHRVTGNVLTCANGSGVKVTCTNSGCTENTIDIAYINAATYGVSILPVNGHGIAYNSYSFGRIIAGTVGIRSYIPANTGVYSWEGEDLFAAQLVQSETAVSFVIDSPNSGVVTDGTISGVTFTTLNVEGSTYGVVCRCGTVNSSNINAGIKSVVIQDMRCREYGRTTKFLQTSGFIRDLYIKPASNIRLSQWDLNTTSNRTCVVDATIFNYSVSHNVGRVLCAQSGVTYIRHRCSTRMSVAADVTSIDFEDMALDNSELYMPDCFMLSDGLTTLDIHLDYFFNESAHDLLFSVYSGTTVHLYFPNGSAKTISNSSTQRNLYRVSCMRNNNDDTGNIYIIQNTGTYSM